MVIPLLRVALALLQELPVRFRHADRRARHMLDPESPAVMVVVGMGDEHVLDLFGVEAELPDVVEERIDRLGARCIDEHEPAGRGDQIGADVVRPNVVDVVENLERNLDLPVAAVSAPRAPSGPPIIRLAPKPPVCPLSGGCPDELLADVLPVRPRRTAADTDDGAHRSSLDGRADAQRGTEPDRDVYRAASSGCVWRASCRSRTSHDGPRVTSAPSSLMSSATSGCLINPNACLAPSAIRYGVRPLKS